MDVSVVIISKDELALAETLGLVRPQAEALGAEVIVVDASDGRVDEIRDAHPWVRWIAFPRPPGVRISIPHQRNAGMEAATGDIIVFIDCGCSPEPDWLAALVAPIVAGEEIVTCGPAIKSAPSAAADPDGPPRYVRERGSGNLAFLRSVLDAVGGFDESFEYGSDVDFTWRLNDAGLKIRFLPHAVVDHDWGDKRRQRRRSMDYGVARARLYRKHPNRIPRMVVEDPVTILYPAFLVGLPLTLRYRWYPLLVLVPLVRLRHEESPVRMVVERLVQGVGLLGELAGVRR